MTSDLVHGGALADLRLDAADTAGVDRLARAMCAREPGRVDAPEWVSLPGKERFSGNAGSALLTFHNENAFHR